MEHRWHRSPSDLKSSIMKCITILSSFTLFDDAMPSPRLRALPPRSHCFSCLPQIDLPRPQREKCPRLPVLLPLWATSRCAEKPALFIGEPPPLLQSYLLSFFFASRKYSGAERGSKGEIRSGSVGTPGRADGMQIDASHRTGSRDLFSSGLITNPTLKGTQ